MDNNFINALGQLLKIYIVNYPEDIKTLTNIIKSGNYIEEYKKLHINLKSKTESISKRAFNYARFIFFLGYCLKFNNGVPLIEIINTYIDNGSNKEEICNAVRSQKTILDFLNKNQPIFDALKDYADEKDIIEYAIEEQKKSTGVLKRNLERVKPHISNDKKLNMEKSKSEILKENLNQYGFFKLEKVKSLSESNKVTLIEAISQNGIPYAIAMFDYLGYLKLLEKEYLTPKYKLHRKIASWFNSDKEGRAIRGNINSLLIKDTTGKERYTAFLHKETVKIHYEQLK